MSEKNAEEEVYLKLKSLKNIKDIKKDYKAGDWNVDFIIETPNKGLYVFEVKDRPIGIPDVLSVASSAGSLSHHVTAFSGAIATNTMPSESVFTTAEENSVVILNFQSADYPLKTQFITYVTDIEAKGRKLLESTNAYKSDNFSQFIENACEFHIIESDSCSKMEHLLQVRNNILHNKSMPEKDLNSAVDEAKEISQQIQGIKSNR